MLTALAVARPATAEGPPAPESVPPAVREVPADPSPAPSQPSQIPSSTASGLAASPVPGPPTCLEIDLTQGDWLEGAHSLVVLGLCRPALWFDGFFGEQRTLDMDPLPETLARLRLSLKLDEVDDFTFLPRFQASYTLPKANRRLKLLVSNRSEEEAVQAPLAEDPLAASNSPGRDDNAIRAGLRFDLVKTPTANIEAASGARLRKGLEPFARLRYRQSFALGGGVTVAVRPSLQWRRDEGHSQAGYLDLEKRLGEKMALRVSQAGRHVEGVDGVALGTDVSLMRELARRRAISLEVGQYGTNRPSVHMDTYRAAVRWRAQTPREWLFYEVEPGRSWIHDDQTGRYRPVWSVTFRLEFVFTG